MNSIEKLENTLKSGEVVRYHTTPRVGRQSNAEHSWNVAIIYWWLFGRPNGLVHDAPELYVGDLPAPTKAYISACVPILQNLEKNYASEKLLFAKECCEYTIELELADKLEAVRFASLSHSADANSIYKHNVRHVEDLLVLNGKLEPVEEKVHLLLAFWEERRGK